jgi:hypothetical protein
MAAAVSAYNNRVTGITGSKICIDMFDSKSKRFIFVGPSLEETNPRLIEKYFNLNSISYVCNVAEECRFCYHNIKNITYKKIFIDDSLRQDIITHFNEAHRYFDFAFQDNSNIYLNCAAGISRSITILISYLMFINKVTFDIAYKYVYNIRPIAKPNSNFKEQLREYQKLLKIEPMNEINKEHLKKHEKLLNIEALKTEPMDEIEEESLQDSESIAKSLM